MPFSQELKKELFDLALAMYRVTELFPKDETLKKKLREGALDLLTKSSPFFDSEELASSIQEALASLEYLRTLTALSQEIGLIRAINAEVLEREYAGLWVYFEQELANIKRKAPTPVHLAKSQNGTDSVSDTRITINDILKIQENKEDEENKADFTQSVKRKNENNGAEGNGRKDAILDYLRANIEAKMVDFVTIFSNRFSTKTLQRDLSRLIAAGKIVRHGDKRWAVYKLNGS